MARRREHGSTIRDARASSFRFLETWAPHLMAPGGFSSLTPSAAAFAVAAAAPVARPEPEDPGPLAQGFSVRPDLELYAVGRGVGAAVDAAASTARTACWALAVALREIAGALERPVEDAEAALQAAAEAVASRMREAAQADPIFESAGCAATLLWLAPEPPLLLHAGDCEAVRLRAGMAQPLTVEHTLERDCRDKGIPLPSPYVRSVLLRLLGAHEPRGRPEVIAAELAPDDRVLLLSTDVASRLVTADYAAAFVGSPAEAARKILGVALGRKAPEAAVVVVDLM